MHTCAYRAQPVKRRFIPKPDGRQRPLGIAALEDKIVQRAVVSVLEAIYEEDFLGFSYGFRPGWGQHDALDALCFAIERTRVNWILDADIWSFFDQVDQQWLTRFLGHRVGDERIVRLVRKWLEAGVLEDGRWSSSDRGTPQGAVISPLLANVYLHYVFDLWARQWRRRECRGHMIVVRYADDIVVGFEHEADAKRFWDAMRTRFETFGLELQQLGLGKPPTFNFLGFTFICGRNRRGIPTPTQEPVGQDEGHAAGGEGGAAPPDAPVHPDTGTLAARGGAGLPCLPRGADQFPSDLGLPVPRRQPVAAHAEASQPEGRHDVGADRANRCGLVARAPNPSSLAREALRRKTPEVGARCVNCARRDLCGGCWVTGIPTAIARRPAPTCGGALPPTPTWQRV